MVRLGQARQPQNRCNKNKKKLEQNTSWNSEKENCQLVNSNSKPHLSLEQTFELLLRTLTSHGMAFPQPTTWRIAPYGMDMLGYPKQDQQGHEDG